MPSLAATGRADLTDAQWAILEPLLPVGKKPGRPPTWTKRQLLDGIRWRSEVGVGASGRQRRNSSSSAVSSRGRSSVSQWPVSAITRVSTFEA
nr:MULTISPECIES: transposase [unclassified Amycolatopsis]